MAGKRKNPTEDAAVRNMSRSDARMRKALAVARMAIELCAEELRGR